MTITVGANSWVTLSEANTYFEGSYQASDPWSSLSDSVKKRLLVSAYRWINQQSIFSVSASSTSQKLKDAQCEAAWYLFSFGSEDEKRRALSSQGVTEFEIIDWREKLSGYNFPQFLRDILDDFYVGKGGYKFTVSRDY